MISKPKRALGAALVFFACALPAAAVQLGDPTFAGGGIRTMAWTAHEFIGLEGELREDIVAVAGDGTVYIAHEGPNEITIAKLDANGDPVSSYTGAGVSRVPLATPFDLGGMHVEPGGALILGGGRDLIRVDAAGRVDTTFGENGRMRIPYIADSCAARIRRILPTSSGAWIAVGVQSYLDATTPTPTERGCTFFARVKANGASDFIYGTYGNFTRPGFIAFDAVMRADGVIEAIGRIAGQTTRRVERYTPEGAPLLPFGTFGVKELPDNGFAVTDSDGRILADGSLVFAALTAGSQPTIVMHRYRADHTFDPLFAGIGRTILAVRDTFIRKVRVLPTIDGGFIARAVSNSFSVQYAVFYKVNARGFLDERFGDRGYARHLAANPSEATGWAVQPDGYVVYVAVSHDPIVVPPTVPPPSAFVAANPHATRIQAVPDIVEFRNRFTNHYFVAYDGLEAVGIDNGAAGLGWERTGETFRPGGTTAVCRFYNGGANTHFFTIEAGECEDVKRSPGWTFEGLGFFGTRLVNGACPARLRTVHRLFNNRERFNDSNHRYIVELSLVPAMAAQGWSLEGPVFCTKP